MESQSEIVNENEDHGLGNRSLFTLILYGIDTATPELTRAKLSMTRIVAVLEMA